MSDFNIYDFMGNPPKKEPTKWCPKCRENAPFNADWGICEGCGYEPERQEEQHE